MCTKNKPYSEGKIWKYSDTLFCYSIRLKKKKDDENTEKFMDLPSQLESLRNMKVSVLWIIIGTLEIFPKGLEKKRERTRN